ncbi:zinc finger protein 567-like [Sabethes cyaneus]|uniref:zinc finger protein 567-like n=1 Tax=Sabethes cyaneus TaxID=53552 RepID=UPI00237E10FD|nr:zinc finger protein 567-like [Sabethes cyaneus]
MEVDDGKCFICTEQTGDHSRSLTQLVTKYSGTLVLKVFERFLASDLSEIVPTLIASVVCQECVVKINDYDAAYTKALIIQKEFTDLLKKNAVFVGRNNHGEVIYFKEEPDTACLDEMQDYSHTPDKAEETDFHVEYIDETDTFSLGEEYVEEEHLNEDMYEQVSLDNPEEETHSEDISKPIPEKTTHVEKKQALSGPQKCSVYKVDFKTKKKLKMHIEEHHPDIAKNGNNHKCDICGLKVKTKSNLLSHMAKHVRNNKYTCSFCGRNFQSNGALTKHVPMHTAVNDSDENVPLESGNRIEQLVKQQRALYRKIYHIGEIMMETQRKINNIENMILDQNRNTNSEVKWPITTIEGLKLIETEIKANNIQMEKALRKKMSMGSKQSLYAFVAYSFEGLLFHNTRWTWTGNVPNNVIPGSVPKSEAAKHLAVVELLKDLIHDLFPDETNASIETTMKKVLNNHNEALKKKSNKKSLRE